MDAFNFSLERKLYIFRALSAGPMRLDDLHRVIFRSANGEQPCKRVFNRMMQKLKDGEYIDTLEWRDCTHKNGVVRLAFLQPRGANLLCANYGIERDHIRMRVPRVLHMRHELILSNIVRFLRSEEDNKKYVLESYHDDTIMKRNLRFRGTKGKNVYLPDLKCRVNFDKGTAIFNLELDCGHKGRKYWSQKIRTWGDPTLLITLNSKRADRLANYALNDMQRRGMICAISLPDLYKVGLTHFRDALLSPLNMNVFLYGANI